MNFQQEIINALEKETGAVFSEGLRNKISNDHRNPVKDWRLFDSANCVKLLYFTRILAKYVLQKSTDQTAIALAKSFNALDHSTNLMRAWEGTLFELFEQQKDKEPDVADTTTTTKEVITKPTSISLITEEQLLNKPHILEKLI